LPHPAVEALVQIAEYFFQEFGSAAVFYELIQPARRAVWWL
jgi:hypothetical protein